MSESSPNNNIAVVCDDLTEFYVIKGAIDELKKFNIPVDIIVPYDSGYNGLAKHTFRKIKEMGYSLKNDAPKNKEYKILLTPYPGLDVVRRMNYIYHIRFPYGAPSPKPDPTYLPSVLLDYDAIITFNTFDQKFFDAYGGKVYTVPYWRYHNFKKEHKKSSKATLLILPTFGADISCINHFTDSSIKEIKKNFHVITKAHHAVHFGIDGENTLKRLEKIADEFYDSDTPIDQLLKKADIVLSDNSGAIFEAVCAGVPVALFAPELNIRKLHTIDTLQYQLVNKKIFPYTNQPEKISSMLLNIEPYIKKQSDLRDQLFLKTSSNPYKEFIDIIKFYLSSDETQDYRKVLHDIMVNEWYNDKKTLAIQEEKIKELEKSISNLQNSTSWKITKPLRMIKKHRS